MPLRTLIVSFLLLALAAANAAPVSSRIAQRYKQMLEQNPVEGTALDRLWQVSQESSAAGSLIDEYKAASGKFPGAMIYGHLLRKAGRLDEARIAYDHAAALDEKSALPHLALAHLFSEQQKPKEAAVEFEKSTALLSPDDSALSDILLKLGDAWLAANEPAKAADAWERTASRDPANLALRQRLAENYEKNGLPEKAITHYEYLEAHGDVVQQAQALQNLARIHQSRGEQDAAIESLDKALALTAPGNWMRGDLQARLIRLHQRYHRTDELEQRWKKNAEQNPRDLAGYIQLIDLYERLGDLDQERLWLEKLADLTPKNADNKIKLARLLVQLNQLDRAADLFDGILKEQPANADLVFARAEIDLQRETPQNAKTRIEALLQAVKNDETVQARALDFYAKHRLLDSLEQHLKTNATNDDGVLALARFYFSQRKPEDARRTLQWIFSKNAPLEKQSASLVKISQELKEQGDSAGALESMQRAVELQPRTADLHLALADLLLAVNRFDDAQKEAEQAYHLSADDSARIVADQKTFQIFQMRAANKDSSHKTPLPDAVPPPRISRSESAPLQMHIAALTKDALENPSRDAFLRVSRWHSWNRNYKAALDFCHRAIELDPDSIDAREYAVKAASADRQKAEVNTQLRKLASLNPAKKQDYAKQIVRLEMESGQFEDAPQFFSEMEKQNPGNIETLADLAAVQQQVGRWDDALATWQRAYDASTAAKKREIAQPLLNAFERLGKHQQAAELLLAATDGQPDENARFGIFQDLVNYCARHELLAWLQQQYDQRHKLHPDDYFTTVALAKILKANGQDNESLAVLSETVYSARNEADALKELVREAEELGDFEAASRHQQRLILLTAQSDSANLEKLATLQENNFEIEAASRTWEKTAGLFPRDPTALNHAAEFFIRWSASDRARKILRKLRAIDPLNLGALMSLANLAEETADHAEALSCCEQLLQNSAPAKADDPFKSPALEAVGASRMRQSYFEALRRSGGGRSTLETMSAFRRLGEAETETPPVDRDFRFHAIRKISQILKSSGDKAALRTWLARWENAPASSEALWAFYYADAHDLTLNQLLAMMKCAPENPQLPPAFVWLALQMGEFARLRDWLADRERNATERDTLVVALEQWLNTNAEVDPRLLTELFNEKFKIRYLMWQAAEQLASHNHFAEAVRLGGRVFTASAAQRAACGVELAHWHIYLGDGARNVLRSVINETAGSFDDPVYEALREYYLLLAENEREPFVESIAHSVSGPPLHSAISLVLLYGLQGDEKSAQAALTRLLGLRAVAIRSADDTGDSAAYRYWTFVLTAGMQLQSWKLDSLAAFLWEQALDDEAGIKLQGDQAARIAREVRLRLFANKLVHADAVETDFLLDDFAKNTTADLMPAIATVLESSGHYALNLKVSQRLWRRDPKNPQSLHNLLAACRAANDSEAAISAFSETLSGDLKETNPAVYRELVAQLVDLLMQNSQWPEAKRALDAALATAPQDVPFLERIARIYEHDRQWDRAADVYRHLLNVDPSNDKLRLAFASVLDSADQTNAAIETLEKVNGARTHVADVPLADLYLKAGRLEKARTMTEKLCRTGNLNAVARIAPRFAETGQQKLALRLMQNAIAKCKEPRMSFELQRGLLELLPPDNAALLEKEDKRLRSLADASPDLLAAYFDAQHHLAEKTHRDFEQELVAAWRDGAGEPIAGAKLIEWYLDAKQEDRLLAVFAKFLSTPDPDPAICESLNARFMAAKRYDLAVQISEILSLKKPLLESWPLNYARALFALGKAQEADSVLEKFSLRSLFSDSIAAIVAQTYFDFGNIPAARRTFEIVLKNDPLVQNYSVYLGYARLLRKENDWRGTKRILLAAFRNPANREVGEIVESYAAAKKLDRIENEIGEFRLSAELLRDLHAALFAHYKKSDDISGAFSVAERHPDLIAREATVRSSLRSMANGTGDFRAAATLFEKVISQSEGKDAALTLDLALLYNDWAAQELAALQSDSALEHLRRANELAPVHLEIAQRLSDLYVEKNQRPRAIEVLTTLMNTTQDRADKEKAKQLLAKYSGRI